MGISKPGEYNKNYVIYNTKLGEELGEYKTEERAKEVLQEIIEAYKESRFIELDSIKAENKVVYEMPEK